MRGGLLLYHNKADYDMYGVEISDLARRHCEKLGIRMGKTLKAFKDVKFDLISAIDVIEHVPDPKALLISFKEVLKPDGAIFLRLPVIDGLTFNRKYPDTWKWVYSPYHLSMFSIKAVQRLSKVCGLECEIIYDETMHANWDLFWFRWQESFFMKNPLTRKICHLLFPIIRKLIIKKYSSDTVFVVLQKER